MIFQKIPLSFWVKTEKNLANNCIFLDQMATLEFILPFNQSTTEDVCMAIDVFV